MGTEISPVQQLFNRINTGMKKDKNDKTLNAMEVWHYLQEKDAIKVDRKTLFKYDKDNNGALTIDEFKEAIKQERIEIPNTPNTTAQKKSFEFNDNLIGVNIANIKNNGGYPNMDTFIAELEKKGYYVDINGTIQKGVNPKPGIYNGFYYVDGVKATGVYNDKCYINGQEATPLEYRRHIFRQEIDKASKSKEFKDKIRLLQSTTVDQEKVGVIRTMSDAELAAIRDDDMNKILDKMKASSIFTRNIDFDRDAYSLMVMRYALISNTYETGKYLKGDITELIGGWSSRLILVCPSVNDQFPSETALHGVDASSLNFDTFKQLYWGVANHRWP